MAEAAAEDFTEANEESPDAKREAERIRAVLQGVVERLEKEATDRVGKRSEIEKRWLANLLQYQGGYDEATLKRLDASKRSKLFINITRPKTNACEARLSDMLFPTDDKNWGIKPTPRPELAGKAETPAEPAQAGVVPFPAQPGAVPGAGQPPAQSPEAQQAQAVIAEATKRAEAMEKTIDDQLRESNYNIEARKVIRDACKLGVGILKGPVATDRTRRSWSEAKSIDAATNKENTIYVLGAVSDPRPAFYRTDPWSFFPDPNARTPEESEGDFERHLMNKKKLRALAKKPGFDADAIRKLLDGKPKGAVPQYINDLRNISGTPATTTDGWYQVWEYRGTLAMEDIGDICACLGKNDMVEDLKEADPLQEVSVVVWFCDGEILKFGIHHLDSGESIYSVFSLDKDEVSILGSEGIPQQMEDSQKALNAAWRMMMDNAGITAGPQIVIDESAVEPKDGDWTMSSFKVWLKKANATGKNAFESHNFNSHQAELANIIALAQKFMDDETNMPVIAQGEQGAHVTKTAQGMALLMNSVNVVFRRVVKNFDDDLTVPSIRRIYDWNMQFNSNNEIKGDFEVDARGSSVLLVRELQSQNLLLMLLQFSGHPVLGPWLKAGDSFRLLVKSMMLSAGEVVKTDAEFEEGNAKAAQQAQQSPEAIKASIRAGELTAEQNLAVMDADLQINLAMIHRDTEMMKLAGKMNMNLDDIRAQLAKMQTDERMFAAEAGLKKQMGTGI